MGRREKENIIYEGVEILEAGAEGKAVARVNDLVVFIPYGAPGDIVDLQVTRSHKRYAEARIVKILRPSDQRIKPFCKHFGICGGCRWQHLQYDAQLTFKEKQVRDSLSRIGKFEGFQLLPILPSNSTTLYRNKLEFTFSNRRWLTKDEIPNRKDHLFPQDQMNAAGFHIPGMFDKVLDIHTCYLQPDPSNDIRLALKSYANSHGLTFYDVRTWSGWLRNLIIRTTTTGQVMVIIVVREELEEIQPMVDFLVAQFPQINSLYVVFNQKQNDSLYDQKFRLFHGQPWIREVMPAFRKGDPDLEFRIGPLSFYQTNPVQAARLYATIADFAAFRGDEIVYDLYTGTGTIATYISGLVSRVVGIETVESAVRDAEENARLNQATNVRFVAGVAEKMMTGSFTRKYGQPNIIIADPPRSGLHPDVVSYILETGPEKFIYVSCNPATQARDMALMHERYSLVKCQPVDMFPHTDHVENVALLVRKDLINPAISSIS